MRNAVIEIFNRAFRHRNELWGQKTVVSIYSQSTCDDSVLAVFYNTTQDLTNMSEHTFTPGCVRMNTSTAKPTPR